MLPAHALLCLIHLALLQPLPQPAPPVVPCPCPTLPLPAPAAPARLQRRRLPIYAHRTQLLYLVEAHATTVVVGETGSGKTTQLPQYLHEAGGPWLAAGKPSAAACHARRGPAAGGARPLECSVQAPQPMSRLQAGFCGWAAPRLRYSCSRSARPPCRHAPLPPQAGRAAGAWWRARSRGASQP